MMNPSKKNPHSFTHLGKTYLYHSLPEASKEFPQIKRLPYSLKILLENLLRHEGKGSVEHKDIENLIHWDPQAEPQHEIQFTPGRTVLQDFTGVPAIADLASIRDAVKASGGNPESVNPLQPVDLVIDHSVQIDYAGSATAFEKNTELEFERNEERYQFLKWAQATFKNLRVVPPGTGIIHQVNLEYLAQCVLTVPSNEKESQGEAHWIYPETLVGTDSHTTMINGLGILGWGVGGIEAEAAMLGQPCSMLIPQVLGVKLTGQLPTGTTATDLVLTITQALRKKGVVGKFVEFYGPGLAHLSLADRATIANMAPEYGATMGLFPIDSVTTDYLKQTGRQERAELVQIYYQKQELWHEISQTEAQATTKDKISYSDHLEISLDHIEPCLAGPSRPQDRVPLAQVPASFQTAFPKATPEPTKLSHGSVVIAAITSCTNTSNPALLIAAGLLAQNAERKGLRPPSWVKTSFAPGSQVVTDYLKEAHLMSSLEALGFHLAAYGCTTCIGNSGPLAPEISKAITDKDLTVAAVLSGNRNFEGRVHPQVKANYLASPPLVVAYALAGTIHLSLDRDPLGFEGQDPKKPVYLKDLWPKAQEIEALVRQSVTAERFQKSYRSIFQGSPAWQRLSPPKGLLYPWKKESSYIQAPPFLKLVSKTQSDIQGAHVLAFFGDSITTDHISPAGSIGKSTPAGKYLSSLGVEAADFNSYGARRGNHEVMVRGTFANTRIKNKLVPGMEGGITIFLPEKKQLSIYEAAMLYQEKKIPLIILAGKEYGTGSSRDWAAKGTLLLGVRAVLAESFERIHRSNLVGMGVLPLEFLAGQSASTFGFKGDETFSLSLSGLTPGKKVAMQVSREGKPLPNFEMRARIDTPNELESFRQGGTLPSMKGKWISNPP